MASPYSEVTSPHSEVITGVKLNMKLLHQYRKIRLCGSNALILWPKQVDVVMLFLRILNKLDRSGVGLDL